MGAVLRAMLTTFPVDALLGRGSTRLTALLLAVAAVLVIASSRLWRWSLRH
ncbi:MAG TPA: hypothetical protein VLA54_11045 [Acidimicrobiia bacterium]|nr:hypothetical protein [Acidimicrobiia bacterium]